MTPAIPAPGRRPRRAALAAAVAAGCLAGLAGCGDDASATMQVVNGCGHPLEVQLLDSGLPPKAADWTTVQAGGSMTHAVDTQNPPAAVYLWTRIGSEGTARGTRVSYADLPKAPAALNITGDRCPQG